MATAKVPPSEQPLRTVQRAPGTVAHAHADLVVLSLNDRGFIRDCSEACEKVFGYPVAELIGCHVSTLLPQLPEAELVQDGRINAQLAYLCHCGLAFQAQHRNGHRFGIELFINRLDHHNIAVLVRSLAEPLPDGAAGRIH